MSLDKHILVDLHGGLGNQLFQIANGYNLSKLFNAKLHIRTDKFHCGQGCSPDKYYTTIYKNIATCFSDKKYNCVYYEKDWNYYNYNIDVYKLFQENNSIIICGYWQSENYFMNSSEELKELFDLHHPFMHIPRHIYINNPSLLEIDKNSCLLCVRRGDYVKKPELYFPCGMTYFTQAMTFFTNDTRYYIVSDDLDWCRTKFKGDQFVFLDIDELNTFYIGQLFPSYIISNSSFHWWISYFSIHKNPRIIAPNNWILQNKTNSIYRSNMIILERPVEID